MIMMVMVAVFVAIFPIVSFAVQGSENSNGADNTSVEAADGIDASTDDSVATSTSNKNYNFSEDTSVRTEIKNRVLENNPLVGEMAMEEVRELVREEATGLVADKIQASRPEYSPAISASQVRKSEVEDACNDAIVLSAMMADETLGQKLENSAKTYLLSEDKVNQALDDADVRTGFAKFFVGPNYGELATVKAQIEQNQLKIQEMNQIHAQIQNEADQTELKVSIQTLEEQNTALQDQLDVEEEVFSLFGWLARWISSY